MDKTALQKLLDGNFDTQKLLAGERQNTLQKIAGIKNSHNSLNSSRLMLKIEKQDLLAIEDKAGAAKKEAERDALNSQFQNDKLAGLERLEKTQQAKILSLDEERKVLEKKILEIDDLDLLEKVEKKMDVFIPLLKRFRSVSSQNEKDSYSKIADKITEISLI